MKKLIIEFLGTFFLVLTIALTGNAIAIAAMLMAWVYIGGYISGAHYNPAVSLAATIARRLDWQTFVRYAIVQVLGGLAAYALAAFLGGHVAVPTPGANVSIMQAGIVEVLLAFVLALVVLMVATAPQFKNSYIFGFAIGFTIPALAAVGGPISGGLFNPALALGSHLYGYFMGAPIVIGYLAMYVIGALLGGALAAYFFNYLVYNNRDVRP